MSDILSQGGDREPGLWRRRAVVIAVLALAAVLVVCSFRVTRTTCPGLAPSPRARLR